MQAKLLSLPNRNLSLVIKAAVQITRYLGIRYIVKKVAMRLQIGPKEVMSQASRAEWPLLMPALATLFPRVCPIMNE